MKIKVVDLLINVSNKCIESVKLIEAIFDQISTKLNKNIRN